MAACTPSVVGCTNPAAENYHEGANVDVGCLFAGCRDSTRSNFDATATVDSGECAAIFLGCTDATALNFHPAFNVDDGSCRVLGCTDSADVGFNPSAVVDGGCATVAGARRRLDGSNATAGCIDPIAANFDSIAVSNDGSCAYNIQGCADSTALNYLSATTLPTPASCDYPVRGCTAPTALNFDSNARVLDSSCVFAKPGCTDTAASTYTAGANVDDGRCVAQGSSHLSTFPAIALCCSYFDRRRTYRCSCRYDILGCALLDAFNYDSLATVSAGCVSRVLGCLDSTARNFALDNNVPLEEILAPFFDAGYVRAVRECT